MYKNSGVASVDRALSIVSAFQIDEGALTLTEIANRTGIYKSTALRNIASLERAGFMRRLPDGDYTIGSETLRLAQIYQASLRSGLEVIPVLKDLSFRSGETASYYVRDNDARVCLHRIEPSRGIHYSIQEGDRLPIHLGASGKVLLAFSSNTTCDEGGEHEEIRESLYSMSYGERDPETASVAVPILGVGQQLYGALALSGPRERFTPEQVLNAKNLLLDATTQLTGVVFGDDTTPLARQRAHKPSHKRSHDG